MSYSPRGKIPAPRCCSDAVDGEMVPLDGGWLCVWCSRWADRDEWLRRIVPPTAPQTARMVRYHGRDISLVPLREYIANRTSSTGPR